MPDIGTQFSQLGGSISTAYNTGLFGKPGLSGILDGYAVYETSEGQDAPCLVAHMDLNTGLLVSGFTSCTHFPARWGGCHFGPQNIGTWQAADLNPLNKQSNQVSLGGPFKMDVLELQRGSNWSSTTSVPSFFVDPDNTQLSDPIIVHSVDNPNSKNPISSGLQDGDPVVIKGFSIPDAPANGQFYAKVSGLPYDEVSLYKDPGLTQPVNGAGAVATNGWESIYFAQTCPTGLSSQWTSGMEWDSTGAVGRRCITLKINGEPCSIYATSAEHAVFPCEADPTNVTKSSLQDIQPGDFIADYGNGGYEEKMVVVKVVKNSNNDIDVTLMRWWGDEVGCDKFGTDPSGMIIPMVGRRIWFPAILCTGGVDFTNMSDPTDAWLSGDWFFSSIHGDYGSATPPALYDFVNGQDLPILNQTPQTFNCQFA